MKASEFGRMAQKVAEGISGLMLGAMFLTFLLQIFSRYVMVQPFSWTLELCLMLWIWIVFFGNAFVLENLDHVTFDIAYLAAPDRIRRIMALISTFAVAIAFAVSILPTWDWIDFLKIKRSASLGLSMRTIYSIYAVFLIAVTLRFAWRFIRILRHGAPREDHIVHVGEEG